MYLNVNSKSASKSRITPLKEIWETDTTEITKYPLSARLIRTDVKVKERERSQPIRIGQLLGITGNSKSAQKSCGSVRKRTLPERLPNTVISSKSTRSSAKPNRFTSVPFITPGRNVRRNLNFNELQQTTSRKSVTLSKLKNSAVNGSQSSNKNPRRKSSRASLIPQSNAVKDAHLRKQNTQLTRVSKISEVSERQSSINMDKVLQSSRASVSTNSDAQATKSLHCRNIEPPKDSNSKSIQIQDKSPTADKSNTNHFYTEISTPEIFKTSGSTIVTSTNARTTMCPTQLTFVRNEHHLNSNVQPHAGNNVSPLVTTTITHNTMKNRETETSGNIDGCLKNICTVLKATRLSTQIDVTQSKNVSPDMICVDKETILHLQNNLKLFVSSMENNVANLKTSLMLLTTAISNNVSHERNTECKSDCMKNKESMHSSACPKEEQELNESETKIATNMAEPIKIMLDKECQVEMCCKNTQLAIDASKESAVCTPKILSIKVTDEGDESNKENDQDSNSNKRTDNLGDDSFLDLEKDLNIVHVKQLSQNQNIRKSMPNLGENKKSLREYMALKSSLNFLETPNTNRFKTHLSTKILKDLRNLYSDSPDA